MTTNFVEGVEGQKKRHWDTLDSVSEGKYGRDGGSVLFCVGIVSTWWEVADR